MNGNLSRYVEKSLRKGWSPETITARIVEENKYEYASSKSIRKFVNKRPSLEQFLFWHRNKHKTGPKSNAIFLSDLERKSIDTRPYNALYEYGHWEGDFIVSKHNSFVLLVLVEKYSKKTLLRVLDNRKNILVNKMIKEMLRGYTVHTVTFDNDIAFSKWRDLEKILNAKIYFCHPYHSWEKGLVENTNRWVRQFIKKKSDLKLYSKEYIQWVEDWLNHTPRQCLEGKTAYEILMREEFRKEVKSLEINLPRLRIWG
jgi:IS30 family transposase